MKQGVRILGPGEPDDDGAGDTIVTTFDPRDPRSVADARQALAWRLGLDYLPSVCGHGLTWSQRLAARAKRWLGGRAAERERGAGRG